MSQALGRVVLLTLWVGWPSCRTAWSEEALLWSRIFTLFMDVMKNDLVCMMRTYFGCTKLNPFTVPCPTIILFPYLHIVNCEISDVQNVVDATAVRSTAIATIVGAKPIKNFGIVPRDEIFKIFILLVELGDDGFFICREEFEVGDLGFLA